MRVLDLAGFNLFMHLRVLSTFFISFHIGEIWNGGCGNYAKPGAKNNANPCDTENMIFVIQATERLENDEYSDTYYKLIKNMILGLFLLTSHHSTIVRVFFLSQ